MVKIRGKSWTFAAVALLTILFYHNLLRIYYVSKINDLRNNILRLSKKQAIDAGFAYVFYATSVSYACSALVNIHQLQARSSTVPIHVLASEKVPQVYIDAFAAAGATVHVEKTPELRLQLGHYYQDCLLKLVVFKMHKLDHSLNRVLLVDSDQLILRHFDNLFSDIPQVDLAAPRAYWLSPEEAVFSSAFMLINLSDRLWDKVNNTLPTDEDSVQAEPKWDMDILNDELGSTAMILNGEYVTLNSHWEAWDLPNWYHPEDTQHARHDHSILSRPKMANKLGLPIETGSGPLDDDQVPLASMKAEMAFSEESDIYKQLVELYDYTSIIHFTALGKPWMYSAQDVTQLRERAHPGLAHQFGVWRDIAEQMCPEGYLVSQ
ncbi:hypothetical protein J7T55_005508 [Diaporthe amygdali]|uniref:uncharacterized protein n=1 Tax=Phomopsis amygdali TaxID=1214568 RepID=UPI0022FDC024|nr:uncharacterized protein J7T55_005508 [Diaporthe amygdali]KAJ0108960.1 hypothetical protein J7T55_005508 [Diaporthe amygdali]